MNFQNNEQRYYCCRCGRRRYADKLLSTPAGHVCKPVVLPGRTIKKPCQLKQGSPAWDLIALVESAVRRFVSVLPDKDVMTFVNKGKGQKTFF